MDIVHIRKTKVNKDGVEKEVYLVSAIPMQKPDGSVKKIPHPQGYDNIAFKTLEKAIEALDIAGFGYSIDDKQVPPSEIRSSITPDLSSAVDPLLDMLKDANSGAIASAAYALGELRAHEAIKPLIQILGEDDPVIRKNATEALAKIGDPAINALINALESENWVVRNSASIALGELVNYSHGKILRAISHLTKRLRDSNWIVRSSAATSIGKIAEFVRNAYQQ
ncbi:MAG: HEAT repeat domain-containing protein [Cyanobacteriota bacterium]